MIRRSSREININKKFQPLWSNTSSRYFIITGGRGSGKSFAINLFLTHVTYSETGTILFTRYTNVSADKSIIPEFIDKIAMQNLENHFKVNKKEVINIVTESKVIFTGLKTSSGQQTAALKSIHDVHTWVLDEAEEMDDEEFFDKIDLSIRKKDVQNRVILVLNPAYRNHFIYRRFFEEAGVNEDFNGTIGDVTYINTTYLDNYENLSRSFIKRVDTIRSTNLAKYNTVVLGKWSDASEGAIFKNWKFGKFNIAIDLVGFGQDYGFNVDPTTLVKVAIDTKHRKIYVKEYLYEPFLSTSDIYKANKIATHNKSIIIADSAEPRLINELQDLGNNIEGVKKPKILDSIITLQDYEIIVDENSENIAKELRLYTWLKNKQIPVDRFNHTIDAIRYIFTFLTGNNRGDYYFD